MGSRHRRSRTLEECLYYAVREDFNCRDGERFLEPDERILPALDFLAATDAPPDSPYICRVTIEALCRALRRRGRFQDLRRIPWLKVEMVQEQEEATVGR